jgi:hypothetical protein
MKCDAADSCTEEAEWQGERIIPTKNHEEEVMSRVERAIRLLLREMRDGCPDCRACKAFCQAHEKVMYDLIIEPRKNKDLRELLRKQSKSEQPSPDSSSSV